jgi:hypothetical protein
VECRRLLLSYAEQATQLAAAQRQLSQYRPPSDTSFPSLWANCMKALAVSRTLRDDILFHFDRHAAPHGSERAAKAS